ncbi:efflux RND transporter periplasmic adaptor subunit [Sphingomonas glacialis]|uniref:Efflux RND transporter periplasmic adaptor subunit n=1 Tax=Sphingomonas glacialis TaxID=658225 RepID=A0A502FIU7_9SPHN|nr:efflux RND transporter periplasmic adaptor subunit [Sphingomonas glacialis]TPG49341.1 efflux RND transporter periplasmic adaptor subunit [Sphingomonas glacialis]
MFPRIPARAAARCCAALIAAVSIAGCSTPKPPETSSATLVDLVVAHHSGGDSATLDGVVRPRRDIGLGFRTGGRIALLSVEVGDHVRKGQVLARLASSDLNAATRQARADLAATTAEAVQAQDSARRAQGLDATGALSSADVKARALSAAAAAARRDAAHAALDRSRTMLSDAVLVAPEAGVVTDRLIEPGTVVDAGSVVVRLAAGDAEVEVKLPETMRLGADSTAAISFPSQAGIVVRARLRRLAPAGDSLLRLRAARFVLPARPGALPFNSSASVAIASDQIGPRIRIPLAAVSGRGGRGHVWLVTGHTVHRQPISILELRGDEALVAGLEDGQRIVASGGDTLAEGQRVVAAGYVQGGL